MQQVNNMFLHKRARPQVFSDSIKIIENLQRAQVHTFNENIYSARPHVNIPAVLYIGAFYALLQSPGAFFLAAVNFPSQDARRGL
jgi:hypothetical protein